MLDIVGRTLGSLARRRTVASTRTMHGRTRALNSTSLLLQAPTTTVDGCSSSTGGKPTAATATAAVRAILRQHGPLPLAHLSKHLDDDTMEWASTQTGGLAGVLTSSTALSASKPFPLVTLPGNVRVLFPDDFADGVAEVDRALLLWLAARFVAFPHFPRAGLLPSPQPTTAELYDLVIRNAKVLNIMGRSGPGTSLATFEEWLLRCGSVFFTGGKRVVLTQGESNTEAFARMQAGLSSGPWRRRRVHNQQHQQLPTDGTKAAQRRVCEAVAASVPATFFIPASVAVRCPSLASVLAGTSYCGTAAALREVLETQLPQGYVDVRTFGPALSDMYVRVLDPRPPSFSSPLPASSASVIGAADVTLASRYGVWVLAERVVSELARARANDPAQRRLQSRGLRMTDLPNVLSPESVRRLQMHFGDEQLGVELQNEGRCSNHNNNANGEASLDACILLFDRLRHVFDVRLQSGVVRPLSVLPAAEQPSSLTVETTPLPFVLRHAQSVLLAATLSVEDLYLSLPVPLRQQLLAAYGGAAWVTVSPQLLEGHEATSKGSHYLRGFVRQHSLYFALRPDRDGTEKVCAPKFLAAAYAEGGGGGDSNLRSGRHGSWANAKKFSDAEKARMIYELLPVEQPVTWTHFSNTPEIRALPFPAFTIKLDFFNRYRSFFRVYESFANSALIVGRADGTPPPADVLATPLATVDEVVHHLALVALDGTSDAFATQSLSRQGRSFVRRLGSYTALAEQLPEWFAVQRDPFNIGNTLITYIGPGGAASASNDDAQHAGELPLRTVRNDASCYLPRERKSRGGEQERAVDDNWDPDWDES